MIVYRYTFEGSNNKKEESFYASKETLTKSMGYYLDAIRYEVSPDYIQIIKDKFLNYILYDHTQEFEVEYTGMNLDLQKVLLKAKIKFDHIRLNQ